MKAHSIYLGKIIYLLFFIFTLFGCKNTSNKNDTTNTEQIQTVTNNEIYGNYVSEYYAKRAEGYDWIAIIVKRITNSTINISIRSRADKKKPTCTFDTKAQKVGNNKYKSNIEGKLILFTFENNTISISTEKYEDSNVLKYYCNGGASLAGSFTKVNEPLDSVQIDKKVYYKNLQLQNIGFDITSTGKGSIQQLTIEPYGLSIDNRKQSIEIDGTIVNTEIEDLDSDGFPEVLIYTQSAGSGSYSNVIAFSVNNGKSMSRVAFNNVTNDKTASKGFMGHDQFKIIETSLVQRFPIYNEGDTNSNPTGKIRQIQYKLENGEASKIFVIKNITEFER